MVIPECEGFHLKTRSVMKQLLEDVKWKVLSDKSKKSVLFKIRVDLWYIYGGWTISRGQRKESWSGCRVPSGVIVYITLEGELMTGLTS